MRDITQEIIKKIVNPPKWSDWEHNEFVLCSKCKHGCKRDGEHSGCHSGKETGENNGSEDS